MHVGEGPRAGQMWGGGTQKTDSWPKLNKDPEELLYATDLPVSLQYPSS